MPGYEKRRKTSTSDYFCLVVDDLLKQLITVLGISKRGNLIRYLKDCEVAYKMSCE